MGVMTDGMNIMDYIENWRQDYMLIRYKVKDGFPDEEYREMFQCLQEEGIIMNSSYDDTEWVLKRNDGRKDHVKFNEDISALWNDRMKHYILLKLHVQKMEVRSVCQNISGIKEELLKTNYLDPALLNTYREQTGKYKRNRRLLLFAFGEFLGFIDEENTKSYLEVIASVPNINITESRDLPCYRSIVLFDYVINDFIWRTNVEERARYYPVLIWWKLSGVIPLRPGELYQLPKDCVYEKNGKYYIHIERIKKKFKRKHYTSPIVKDFEIREELYFLIKDYIDYISEFDDTEYLFSLQSLKKVAGSKSREKDVKRLTLSTMLSIYKHFKLEIIEGKYGYHVVPLGQRKNEKDIEDIKMGDVRHLVISNMVMMGYNPLYIMELAGHTKLSTQMNYFNHVDTFLTAKSYVLKEMMKNAGSSTNFTDYGSGEFVLQKELLGASYYDLPLVFDGRGRCRNKGSVHECVYIDCLFCPYFIPDRNLSREYLDALKKENEKDMEMLKLELKLFMLKYTDNREFDRVGREIGVILNKKIMIDAYQCLLEEEEE